MSVKRPDAQACSKIPVGLGPRPLGRVEQLQVEQALADSAPEWSVELHGICADEATLIIVPEDGTDSTGPSFIISREVGGFRLDQVQWDALTELGVHAGLDDVLAVLQLRLAFCTSAVSSTSTVLH